MASTRAIKQRIKSAKNISKITKAMEMVSASKMRRSQQQVLSSRPYAHALQKILQKISTYTDSSIHPLLGSNKSKKKLLVIVSTNRGLVGGLNAILFRSIVKWKENQDEVVCVSIGKRAKQFVRRMGWELYADFSQLPEKISYLDSLPVSSLLMKAFLAGEFQSIHTVHMQMVNTLSQEPFLTQLLPISPNEVQGDDQEKMVGKEYKFEPSPKEILDWLLPYFTENEIYFSLLEGKASEHSARMIAMKNASDNAKEIVSELNLEYNRSRQAKITQELQEITTAILALG